MFQDYLRDEEREVNHHGRIRKIGDEDGDFEEDQIQVLKNNWMEDPRQHELNLISRQEDIQVCLYIIYPKIEMLKFKNL